MTGRNGEQNGGRVPRQALYVALTLHASGCVRGWLWMDVAVAGCGWLWLAGWLAGWLGWLCAWLTMPMVLYLKTW